MPIINASLLPSHARQQHLHFGRHSVGILLSDLCCDHSYNKQLKRKGDREHVCALTSHNVEYQNNPIISSTMNTILWIEFMKLKILVLLIAVAADNWEVSNCTLVASSFPLNHSPPLNSYDASSTAQGMITLIENRMSVLERLRYTPKERKRLTHESSLNLLFPVYFVFHQ